MAGGCKETSPTFFQLYQNFLFDWHVSFWDGIMPEMNPCA